MEIKTLRDQASDLVGTPLRPSGALVFRKRHDGLESLVVEMLDPSGSAWWATNWEGTNVVFVESTLANLDECLMANPDE